MFSSIRDSEKVSRIGDEGGVILDGDDDLKKIVLIPFLGIYVSVIATELAKQRTNIYIYEEMVNLIPVIRGEEAAKFL